MQTELFPALRYGMNDTVVVTALQSELPEMAPEVILFTGVGKVNATHALKQYLVRNKHIRRVINYGTASTAYGVKQGEIVKCTTFLQGELDCS